MSWGARLPKWMGGVDIGRRLTWRTGGLLGLLTLLVVAAFAADGFRSAKVDLNEAGVWVTSPTRAGRLNMQIRQIDATARVGGSSDVFQDGRSVMLVNPGVSLRTIDVATGEEMSTVALPPESNVAMGGGTVALADEGSGRIWVTPFEQVGSIDVEAKGKEAGVARKLGAGVRVAVGSDGTVWAADVASGKFVRLAGHGDDPGSYRLRVEGPDLDLAVIGRLPVAFSSSSMRMQVGDRSVDLSRFGGTGRLQAGPVGGDRVVVATDRGVVAVPVDDGKPRQLFRHDAAAPIRPVVVGGCVYSAWAGGGGARPQRVDRCGSRSYRTEIDGEPGAELEFRVNGPHVALNMPRTGSVLIRSDDEFITVSEWPRETDQENEDTDDPSDSKGSGEQECKPNDKNEPPVPPATPPEFGARPATATVLPVLATVNDANCDVLTVVSVTDISPAVAEIYPVDRGHAVQFKENAGYVGRVTFSVAVTDGRSDPVKAEAVVVVRSAEEPNRPPRQKDGGSRVTVTRGQSVTYDVLGDFIDDDGDPMALLGATATNATGTIRAQSDGTVVFTDDGTATGIEELSLEVGDGRGVTQGVLRVEVVDQVAAVARNDHAVALVGSTITIDPLANDVGANGAPVKLARGPESPVEHATVVADTQSGLLVFTADSAGPYRFDYTISSGASSAVGFVRVDVSEPSPENRPPVAVRDVATVTVGSSVVIDLIANDSDPDLDVLVVQSAAPPAGSGITAQVVERRAVRLTAARALTEPAVVTYLLSDGLVTVEGQVVVQVIAGGQLNQAPTARDDRALVRVGDVVTVPVLANDSDPEGSPLKVTLDPATAFNIPPGSPPPGVVFTDGAAVRFVASSTLGEFSLNYTVVDDAQKADSGLVWITVVPNDERNGAPVPRDVEARTFAGSPVEIRVPTVGIDPDGDSTTVALGPPRAGAKGSAVLDERCGCFVYTPAIGQVGTDWFNYVATDSRGATGTAVVRVGIAARAGNSAPIANPDLVRVRPDREHPVDVLKNDEDSDGDIISLESVSPVTKDQPVTAKLRGDRVVVKGPEGAKGSFFYVINDGRGATASGTLSVEVTESAPPVAPIARDDRPEACKAAGNDTVECDVVANDEDPDGAPGELQVAVPDGFTTATVRGQKVRVTLTESRQVIPYTITDPDKQSATAVLVVNGRKTNLPPRAKSGTSSIQVDLGASVEVEVGDYAVDPEGSKVLLGSPDIAFPRGTAELVSESRFRLVPGDGAVGEGTVSFQVTDGTGVTDTQGLRATITVPVVVRGSVNTAPTFNANPIDVAVADDATKVDLTPFAADVDVDDKLTFSKLTGAGSGLDASLDGSVLTISASDALKKGETRQLGVTVSDGEAEVVGQIPVRLVASTRPKATAAPDTIEAQSGVEVTIAVLDNDVVPPTLGPLKVVEVTGNPELGTPSTDGTVVKFTPTKAFVGTADLTYVINDKLDDEDRKVTGTIRITVKDAPARPTAPTVGEYGNKFVVLTWQAPDDRGQPITKYRVRSTDGAVDKTLESAATQVRLVAPEIENDHTYRFTLEAYNGIGDGWSEPSPESDEVRPDTLPDAPLVAPTLTYDPSQTGSGELLVSWPEAGSAQWNNEGSEVFEYRLVLSPPDGGSGQLTGIPAGTTSKKLVGLKNGTSYTVQVQGRNKAEVDGGWSRLSPASSSEFPAAVPGQVPTPTAQRVDDPLGERIRVTWTRPTPNTSATDCCSYVIKGTRSDGAAQPDVAVPLTTSATITQEVTAAKGFSYTYRIVATNKAGDSPVSAPSAGVSSFTRPEPVSSLSASAPGTNGELHFQFSPPATNGDPIDTYQVQVSSSDGGGGTGARFVSYQGAGAVISGLTNGRNYTFTVAACNQGTRVEYCGQPSPPASASPYGPPGAASVSASHIGSYVIRLNWNATGSTNGRPIDYVRVNIGNGGWSNQPVTGSSDRNVGCGGSIDIRAIPVSAGLEGPERSASASAPACPPPPSVNLYWGSYTQVAGCDSTSCRRMQFDVLNFGPNGSYPVQCEYRTSSGGSWRSDFGYTPPNVITDGAGNGGNGDTPKSCVGNPSIAWEYRVVVNGVASNPIG